MDSTESVVKIVATVMALGIPLSLIVGGLISQYRFGAMAHRERMLAMEKGLPLPPPPAPPDSGSIDKRAVTLSDYLRRGLIWLLASSGLLVSVWLLAPSQVFNVSRPSLLIMAAIGGCVGLAYLVFYFIESRKSAA